MSITNDTYLQEETEDIRQEMDHLISQIARLIDLHDDMGRAAPLWVHGGLYALKACVHLRDQ